MKKIWISVFSFVVLVVGLLLMGPFIPFQPGDYRGYDWNRVALKDLSLSLEAEEAKVTGMKPGREKEIIWANPQAPSQTEIAFVYLHGFSASRLEISPVMETLAQEMNANLYFNRLTAHGLKDGEGFATVTTQDWIDDAREALMIGRKIGRKVVIVGVSTGATLALELARENFESNDIAALVLISPHYEPSDSRAKFISGPLGPTLAHFLIGSYREWKPSNEMHADFWTTRYRSNAIPVLMDLTNRVRAFDVSKIKIPVLTLYTKKDSVVNVELIEDRALKFGSSKKELVNLPEADRHEFAGRALGPQAVRPTIDVIEKFLRN